MPLPTDFTACPEAKRQALLDARTAIAVLEVEVRTYDEIAALLESQRPEPVAPPEPPAPVEYRMPWPTSTPSPRRLGGRPPGCHEGKSRAIILALATAYPRACDMRSLVEELEQAGQAMRRNVLRAALAHYVKLGHIQRIKPGVFRATLAGAKAVGVELGK